MSTHSSHRWCLSLRHWFSNPILVGLLVLVMIRMTKKRDTLVMKSRITLLMTRTSWIWPWRRRRTLLGERSRSTCFGLRVSERVGTRRGSATKLRFDVNSHAANLFGSSYGSTLFLFSPSTPTTFPIDFGWLRLVYFCMPM